MTTQTIAGDTDRHLRRRPGPFVDRLRRHPRRRLHLSRRLRRVRGAADRRREPRLEGSVEVNSISVVDEQLKGHLLSPEFFDAGQYPQLGFESSELSIDEDGAAKVRGTLEIGGQSHEVEADGRFAQIDSYLDGRPRVGLSLATSIDRRDFGLDWQAELPERRRGARLEVEIAVELELVEEDE